MAPPGIGLPYGKWPRLFLMYLTTQAIRKGSRDIELGSSMKAFMRSLGAASTGGATGSIQAFKEQLARTLSMTITLSTQTSGGAELFNAPVSDTFKISWVAVGNDNSGAKLATIRLGERLFNEILTGAVPLDRRAVHAIQQSPMATDLYAWLTFRVSRSLRASGTAIRWSELREQFGSDYSAQSDFRIAFVSALEQVRLVYPDLKCSALESEFVLFRSRTSVGRKAADHRTGAA